MRASVDLAKVALALLVDQLRAKYGPATLVDGALCPCDSTTPAAVMTLASSIMVGLREGRFARPVRLFDGLFPCHE